MVTAVGESWGVLVLLGLTAGMFGAFGRFFFYLVKRSRLPTGDAAGLGVVCIRDRDGERFTFIITDPAKVRALGFQAVDVPLGEQELRAQLAMVGFSEPATEERIQAARAWARGPLRFPAPTAHSG